MFSIVQGIHRMNVSVLYPYKNISRWDRSTALIVSNVASCGLDLLGKCGLGQTKALSNGTDVFWNVHIVYILHNTVRVKNNFKHRYKTMEKMCAKIKERIRSMGQSQDVLAEIIGKSRTVANRKLNGLIPFDVTELCKVTKEYSLTIKIKGGDINANDSSEDAPIVTVQERDELMDEIEVLRRLLYKAESERMEIERKFDQLKNFTARSASA